jgi:hypothetical protein
MPNHVYKIVIKGHLDNTWSEWFGGWNLVNEHDGNTIITSPPIDQVALFSILKKMNDLNLAFISMQQVPNSVDVKRS